MTIMPWAPAAVLGRVGVGASRRGGADHERPLRRGWVAAGVGPGDRGSRMGWGHSNHLCERNPWTEQDALRRHVRESAGPLLPPLPRPIHATSTSSRWRGARG